MKGEFARTVNLTCVHTGWVFTRAIRNNAHKHVLKVLQQQAVDGIPLEMVGLGYFTAHLAHAAVEQRV